MFKGYLLITFHIKLKGINQRRPTFYGKGTRTSLWAGLRAPRGKPTARGISHRLYYCVIYILSTLLTNVAVERIVQPGGPRVGDPTDK
jgi:hypothetical protein